LLEALQYFIRESKCKRSREDTTKDKKLYKIIKAMLVQVNLTDKEIDKEA
jgi:hypothetical protein